MSVRRLMVTLGLAAVAVALGVVLADAFLMPWLIHGQSEVIVPDLVGRSVEDATREVERLGLTLHVGEEVFHAGSPPGVVLEQGPASLTSVRRGRPVRVAVSKGEALSRVPDLTGMSVRQSELTLRREGLELGRVSRSLDPTGPIGVVAQRPYAGMEVAQGSHVTLLIREGHERAQHLMPNLVGRNLTRIREELTRAGFELRRVTYRPDGNQFPGTILDQWPPAGFRVPSGGNVELVASSRS